jgi:hypothetical protein
LQRLAVQHASAELQVGSLLVLLGGTSEQNCSTALHRCCPC